MNTRITYIEIGYSKKKWKLPYNWMVFEASKIKAITKDGLKYIKVKQPTNETISLSLKKDEAVVIQY